jgi:RimJ/RimL family protein N-acetyltransferase
LFVPYAFATRRLRRLEAYVFAANPSSARVLEKCGFVREGILREAVVDREGAVHDAWLYARLRGDPDPAG